VLHHPVQRLLEQLGASARIAAAERIMSSFIARTGADGFAPARRYLWTDAYALLALVGLHWLTGRQSHLDAAAALAHQVHRELGRFRADDARSGWISGLDEREGARRPTAGGLRIGKPEPERAPGAVFDEHREWDRDGQYFHYLTKWMIALNRLAHATDDAAWNDLAVDLALASWPAFAARSAPGGTPRMHWKMSTDLSRPLVTSMGHHDPIDGLATFAQIRASQQELGGRHALESVCADMLAMCEASHSWATTDPLGIGGMLLDLAAIVRLSVHGRRELGNTLDRVLADSARSLDAFASTHELERPVGQRLAFRELGLAIGLYAVEPVRSWMLYPHSRRGATRASVQRLGHVRSISDHADLRIAIQSCWMEPGAQSAPAWRSHEDINAVMLAASLVPDACIMPCAAMPRVSP
jgi:hypothetical protein